MKHTYNILSVLFMLFVVLFTFSGCGDDGGGGGPTETEADKVSAALRAGIWNVSGVTVDGVVSNKFQNMTLTFSASTYSTTNGAVVWPASGTWSFTDQTAKVIRRDDNVDVTIDAVSATSLTLSLTWSKTTLGNGRNESISGRHVFNFAK
jgi:hypothetical protein